MLFPSVLFPREYDVNTKKRNLTLVSLLSLVLSFLFQHLPIQDWIWWTESKIFIFLLHPFFSLLSYRPDNRDEDEFMSFSYFSSLQQPNLGLIGMWLLSMPVMNFKRATYKTMKLLFLWTYFLPGLTGETDQELSTCVHTRNFCILSFIKLHSHTSHQFVQELLL